MTEVYQKAGNQKNCSTLEERIICPEPKEGTRMLTINDWPEQERPREKLLIQGANALSDAELLAIFLRTGISGYTAVDLARLLIDDFGGLKFMLESSETQFCQRPGLGRAKYAQLQAVLEMSRRYLYENIQRGDALCSPRETREYLISQLRGYHHEVFACLFLDNRNRVIAFEKMFYGTIDGAVHEDDKCFRVRSRGDGRAWSQHGAHGRFGPGLAPGLLDLHVPGEGGEHRADLFLALAFDPNSSTEKSSLS